MKFSYWYDNWKQNRQAERLGQAFVNDFVKTQWQELYYEDDEKKALDMIMMLLVSCHYYPNTPHRVGDIT